MLFQQEILQFIVIGTILFLLVALFMVSFLFAYRRRQLKHVKEKKELHDSFQQELLRSQLEIQEQTLQNIAQEIHDNIGQTLSLVKLNLNTLDPNRPNWDEKTRTSKELVGKAIQDLRSLSKSLHSDHILSAGLEKAIAYELKLIEASGVLHTHLQVSDSLPRLEGQKELILFRIVQEALNNIIKHAKAALISVKIWSEDDCLKLQIADDGAGFDQTQQTGEMDSGSGLRNMSNRARLIGGSCTIRSAPNKGTRIELNIPYKSPT